MKQELYKRRFLNLLSYSGIACIETNIPKVGKFENGNGYLTISDCGRQITLDFYVSDKKGSDNSFRKLKVLKEAIEEFESHLTLTRQRVLEVQAEKAKKKKEKKGALY